jgi:hypothetical protein
VVARTPGTVVLVGVTVGAGAEAAVGAAAVLEGAAALAAGSEPEERVIPRPNNGPLLEPFELPPPRAAARGIAYSLAVGLPGSMCTPVGGADSAAAGDPAASVSVAASISSSGYAHARRAIAPRRPNSRIRDWRSLGNS